MTIINPPSRYLRMQDEELHVEETRNSISPSQSRGRRVTTRNQEEQYLHEHYHEYETRNSFSPPQSHGRRVRIDTNKAYQQEQQHEGDSIQTETYMSDDEDGEENIGSTSHGTTENSDFDFKCTRMRSAMSSQLGYQHRNHQYKLHIHYKEYETMEEAMTHPPKGIEVSDWVLLCERFASEDFQISEKNKKNRAKNLVPPTVGTRSLARRVDESRREGKEVSEIEQYKMAHYSKKLKGMINEEADTIWNDLQTEEATSSCTSAEICLKKLGHLPGHIKGRSASTKQILETVNLRSELKALKEENKATNEKVDYLLEEMKKMAQLLQQFQTRFWSLTDLVMTFNTVSDENCSVTIGGFSCSGGGIPASLSQLANLGMLDLSCNNLSGRIPTSTQLQSFGASSYNGNPALYGLPLPNICTEDIVLQNPQTTLGTNVAGDQDMLVTQGFFISLSIRSIFGFWGVCGALVVNDAWRYAYYKFMNHVKDWI
ncbi:leucine-rich repeat protein [Tanacetum coccineum]